MLKNIDIAIIGNGKVGGALATTFAQQDIQACVYERDFSRYAANLSQADLILLTVQDTHIQAVCEELIGCLQARSPQHKLKHLNTDAQDPGLPIIAHCSGALGCGVLKTARESSHLVATAHPLNSFPTAESALRTMTQSEHGTYCFLSGDTDAVKFLNELFSSIGCHTVTLDDDAKAAYHTACVFACNYVTSLMELSLTTAEGSGLARTDFWHAIQPLIKTTLENISRHGTAKALSGPIARGDATTVNKHINLLEQQSLLAKQAYCALGRQALELARQRNELNEETLTAIERSLAND